MDAITPIALLTFAVFTLVNLVRYLRGRDWNGVLTIVLSWIAGVIVVLLFGASRLGEGVTVPGLEVTFGDLGVFDAVFVGLLMASTAGAFNEFNKARDNTQSVDKPPLVP